MRTLIALISIGFFLSSGVVCAGTAEVRDVARLNNCPPKKIEVYQQQLGAAGTTVYRVACVMPKVTDQQAATTADAILIQCVGSLCELLRPVSSENK